jgi:hypothetical protein
MALFFVGWCLCQVLIGPIISLRKSCEINNEMWNYRCQILYSRLTVYEVLCEILPACCIRNLSPINLSFFRVRIIDDDTKRVSQRDVANSDTCLECTHDSSISGATDRIICCITLQRIFPLRQTGENVKTLPFDWACGVSVSFLGHCQGIRRGGFCVENIVDRSHGTSYLIFCFFSYPYWAKILRW